MAKIMLVEDDKNLSAIYRDRLLAEGYEIVSAHDGEEALALAVKEKPDLIVADVMMPKISGFDMLDILRSTPETKNTKVIMMTALSQAEDQQRAAQLGADKYLVKSQVTLDDVARVVKEVLSESTVSVPQADESSLQETTTPAAQVNPTTEVEESNPEPISQPATTQTEAPAQNQSVAQADQAQTAPDFANLPAESTAEEKSEIEKEIEKDAEQLPIEAPANVIVQTPEIHSEKQGGERVIQPMENAAPKPDIMALYQKEIENESTTSESPINPQPATPEQPAGSTADPHSISL